MPPGPFSRQIPPAASPLVPRHLPPPLLAPGPTRLFLARQVPLPAAAAPRPLLRRGPAASSLGARGTPGVRSQASEAGADRCQGLARPGLRGSQSRAPLASLLGTALASSGDLKLTPGTLLFRIQSSYKLSVAFCNSRDYIEDELSALIRTWLPHMDNCFFLFFLVGKLYNLIQKKMTYDLESFMH